jgi:tetratricopeptide (TPR) repeat protein
MVAQQFPTTHFSDDQKLNPKGLKIIVDKALSTQRSSKMRIHRSVLLLLWAINLSAHANLLQPIDVSQEYLRYRHNPQARAVFGGEICDDPTLRAAARSSLYFDQGRSSYKAKQYLSAIRNYSRVLDIHLTSAAFNNRGLAFRMLGNTGAAERDFVSALQLNPNDVAAWTNLGNLMLVLERYDEAINSFSQAIDSGSNTAGIYVARGNAYRAKGDAPNALLDYEAAIARAPTDARAHLGRAAIFYGGGDLDHAKSEFKTALLLNPADLDAMRGLAMVLRDQHRYSESLQTYNLALKVQPANALLLSGRGRTYQEMGNWKEAISNYSQAIALQPSDELLLRLRGLAYDHQEDYGDAIADLTQVTHFASNSTRGYVLLARALAHSHHDEESIDVLSRAIERMPTEIILRNERATLFEGRGDYSSAIREYREIVQIWPTNVESRIFLADDETAVGQYQEAARDYEIASRVAPNEGSLRIGRAKLLFYSGDYLSADSDLKAWQELYRKGKIEASNRIEYYVVIWRHIIALKLRADDRSAMSREAATLDAGRWPYPVLALYMGKASAATLMKVASENDTPDRKGKLCEANAYLGELQLAHGDAPAARHSFVAAREGCPANFDEVTIARWELYRMEQNSSN